MYFLNRKSLKIDFSSFHVEGSRYETNEQKSVCIE